VQGGVERGPEHREELLGHGMRQERWHRVADLLVDGPPPGAHPFVGVGERLKPSRFARREGPVIERVCISAARYPAGGRCDRGRRLIRSQPAVSVVESGCRPNAVVYVCTGRPLPSEGAEYLKDPRRVVRSFVQGEDARAAPELTLKGGPGRGRIRSRLFTGSEGREVADRVPHAAPPPLGSKRSKRELQREIISDPDDEQTVSKLRHPEIGGADIECDRAIARRAKAGFGIAKMAAAVLDRKASNVLHDDRRRSEQLDLREEHLDAGVHGLSTSNVRTMAQRRPALAGRPPDEDVTVVGAEQLRQLRPHVPSCINGLVEDDGPGMVGPVRGRCPRVGLDGECDLGSRGDEAEGESTPAREKIDDLRAQISTPDCSRAQT